MTSKANHVLAAGFSGFLALMLAINILTPSQDFSPRENRYLARLPHFSLNSLVSGRFTRQFEDFLTDQFAGRDFWVLTKSDLEQLRLMRENNGIFLGRDGYLLEHYRQPGRALTININRLNSFARTFPDLDIKLVLAPNSVSIYTDKLPPFAFPYNQRLVLDMVGENLQDIELVDIWPVLNSHRDQYIYFRTDHHWTMRGAFLAYRELAPTLGLIPWEQDRFEIEIVARDFVGTYAARANTRKYVEDYIELWQPRTPVNYTISFKDRELDGLYDWQHLNGRDKYSLFLGGNQPLMVIRSPGAPEQKLAVFKDSYAHSLLPFLANHYSEIHVFDLRYYHQPLAPYFQDNDIEQVLFLFNISMFSSNSDLTRFR